MRKGMPRASWISSPNCGGSTWPEPNKAGPASESLVLGPPEAGQAHVVALGASAHEALDVIQDQAAQVRDRNTCGQLVAQSSEAIQLVVAVHGFADPVGKEREKVTGRDGASVLFVLERCVDAQGQSGFVAANRLDDPL